MIKIMNIIWAICLIGMGFCMAWAVVLLYCNLDKLLTPREQIVIFWKPVVGTFVFTLGYGLSNELYKKMRR